MIGARTRTVVPNVAIEEWEAFMGRPLALVMIVALLACTGLGYYAGTRNLFAPANTLAADDCVTFTQTGKAVCGRFLQYWQQNGGIAQQGLPISESFYERSKVDGKIYLVQYFERAVFEAHPENFAPNDVLLTLLGREKFLTEYPNGVPGGVPTGPSAQPSPSMQPTPAPGASIPHR
jgi:hypothetical protein